MAVVVISNDVFAHVLRLSGDGVNFDPIENAIIGRQSAVVVNQVLAVCFKRAACAKAVRDV